MQKDNASILNKKAVSKFETAFFYEKPWRRKK
jgi:hypothetical protein